MADSRPSTPFRVLVADDAPGIRLLMRHILEGSGEFEVVGEAVDGQQAVDLAAATQPDLVMLDLVMPSLDGVEAIPKIRACSPASRILVLSGLSGTEMADQVAVTAADGYVEKGQHPDEIRRVALDVCRAEPLAPPPEEIAPSRGASLQELGDRLDAQAREMADALARARGDLAEIGASASHDLKSPLQAVLGFAHLLDQLYGAELDERAGMFVRTIIEASEKMAALVDGLARYCRVVSQRSLPGPVALDETLKEVVQGLDALIESRRGTVTSDPLPVVFADPAQVALVLTELVTNAMTWVQPGLAPEVHLSATEAPGGWTIGVQDNGMGIDIEHRRKVFGMFSRLPSSAAVPGPGIGLALCRRLVEGWGGTVWIEEPRQAGTLVCFTVPVGGPEALGVERLEVGLVEGRPAAAPIGATVAAELELALPLSGEAGTGLLAAGLPQLLLVEDSEPHARLVAATLAESPGPRYRLRHVVDLRNARKALFEQRIDCILLDLSLPDGEGLDSLAQVRAMAPSIPIVVLTSRSDEALAVTAVQQGAQDYLVKGAMEPRMLGRSIRYAIERKALEAQLAMQALHDSLTGLPNRVLLLDRLHPALARAGRTGDKIALLYLDLDGFKPVNDELGHEAGDEILVEVARRLTSVVRPQDTVARIGGDEFAILCEGFRAEGEISSLATRMAEVIAQPVHVGVERRSVSASIGIAYSTGPGESAEELIRMADLAMYRNKRREAES